jgi:hydroxymethylglutaryl-CoA synthase
MTGIEAYAIHLPRFRILAEEYRRALGHAPAKLEAKRVHGYDEDAATLAIEAARALAIATPPSTIITASERAPPFGGLVAEAFGWAQARVVDERGATSGLVGLLAARDAVAQGNGAALLLTADALDFAAGDEREASAGSAASAWLVTAKGPVQLRRDAHGASVAEALQNLTRSGLNADSVTHAATAELDGRSAVSVQKALPKARLAAGGVQVGHAGASAVLLSLAHAIEQARLGDVIAVATEGDHGGVAVSFELERTPQGVSLRAALERPSVALDHGGLTKLRGWLSPPQADVSQGAAVSAAQWRETLPARLRFEGQRCAACGHVQFPPRASCKACNSRQLSPAVLRGAGAIHSIATIGPGSAPAEFAEQQRRMGTYDVAILQLEEGPRIAAQVADALPGELHIGDPVRLVVRRLYVQDGAPRYGFKARRA